jgi:hypothetical protein
MNLKQSLVAVTGLAVALQFAAAGNITGKVTLSGDRSGRKGNHPAEGRRVSAANWSRHADDQVFCRRPEQGTGRRGVMLKSDSLKGKSTGATAAPVVLDQKGCEYIPQILAVQTGQKVLAKELRSGDAQCAYRPGRGQR